MEIKSIFYKQYINTQAYQIPVAAIEELIDEFAINAKFYMASDIDADTTAKINNAVVELLKNRFRYVPLKLIGEAYTRGSLGELGGTTRFTIRNVYIWLSQIEEKNQRLFLEEQSKKEDEKRRSEARTVCMCLLPWKLVARRSAWRPL